MARRESARAKGRLREVKDAMTPICRFSRYTWPLIDAHSPLLRRVRRSARRLSALGTSSYGLPPVVVPLTSPLASYCPTWLTTSLLRDLAAADDDLMHSRQRARLIHRPVRLGKQRAVSGLLTLVALCWAYRRALQVRPVPRKPAAIPSFSTPLSPPHTLGAISRWAARPDALSIARSQLQPLSVNPRGVPSQQCPSPTHPQRLCTIFSSFPHTLDETRPSSLSQVLPTIGYLVHCTCMHE